MSDQDETPLTPSLAQRIDAGAQAAYRAYGLVTAGKTHDGRPLPAWEELGDTIRTAWRGAAHAAWKGIEHG